ncbi:MAG: hypothetical protein IKR11_09915 [Solobacterium sp.]|nr:hypothetical protein [Solobacterium sp.]
MNENTQKWIKTAVAFLLGVVSFLLLSRLITSPIMQRDVIGYLDEKRDTVMEITAASTAASAAISMIPGDAGTPIATKMADLSTYSMIVLCAILLEKYLVTVIGKITFVMIVPAGCALYLLYLWTIHELWVKKAAMILAGFSVVLALLVPFSVYTSKTIEQTYETTITETINEANQNSQEIQENADDQGWIDKLLNSVGDGVTNLLHKFENTFNNLIEALAVMIVTSCLIPVISLFIMWKLVRYLIEGLIGVPLPPLKSIRQNM